MSAHVEPAGDLHGWWCPDCGTGGSGFEETDAEGIADDHNRVHHHERDHDDDLKHEREERMQRE